MNTWSIALAFCLAVANVTAAQEAPADGMIQRAIDHGKAMKTKAIWSEIEKRRSVRINRAGPGDTVGKTAIFLTDADTIALAAADAARRHQALTVSAVREWPNLGTVHVALTVEANGIYKSNMPKWEAPAVHMIITADGVEIQPMTESKTIGSETKISPSQTGLVTRTGNITTYTPLYQSALYDVARARTWFSFAIPPNAMKLRVTVISADGHEKAKSFGSETIQ